jgi:hypothetical protein
MLDRCLYILAGVAFADPNFPALSVSIFEDTMHTWMQLPDGMRHFSGAIIAGSWARALAGQSSRTDTSRPPLNGKVIVLKPFAGSLMKAK